MHKELLWLKSEFGEEGSVPRRVAAPPQHFWVSLGILEATVLVRDTQRKLKAMYNKVKTIETQ